MGNRVARLLMALASVLLVACGRIDPPESTGELVIGILSGPTTYQDTAGTISGFEFDLLERFASSLGMNARYVVAKDQAELLEALQAHKIHLAAGVSNSGNRDLVFSVPLRESKQVLIANVEDLPFDVPSDLSGLGIVTLAGSSQAATLKKLAGTPPRFSVVEMAGGSELDILQWVAEGKSQLAATDMLNYSLALNYFPELTVVQELPESLRSAWAFMPEYALLSHQSDEFINAARKDGSLARLHDRYFGHIQRLKSEGVARFIEDMRTLLPRYRQAFQAAQAATGIDWRLLAALAYQESKWDPVATSYTNVRGMMMLTEDTADRMGVNNRLDPAQSIRAGSRYLATMMEDLPEDIEDPDRLWLALAAYNLGMGHLNGARTFATQMKRDSKSWYDMKKVLPLMSRPEFYTRLKSGPARGGEAVIMVENIRCYYDILSRLEPAWQPMPKLTLSQR